MNEAPVKTLTFPARIEELANMCRYVHDAAKACGMDDENLWKLETAVDEACTNIACYGYKGKAEGEIVIVWDCDEQLFTVVIQDNGIAFDQTEPTNPDFSEDICKRSVGGLGRFIMRKFLDDMQYERTSERNTLTLKKRLTDKTDASTPA